MHDSAKWISPQSLHDRVIGPSDKIAGAATQFTSSTDAARMESLRHSSAVARPPIATHAEFLSRVAVRVTREQADEVGAAETHT